MSLDIWYVSIYEPLPLKSSRIRPMRNSLVADALIKAGHNVELWLPGFEHVTHTHFKRAAIREFYNKNFSVQYLEGCGYSSDTSLIRLVHNRQIAKNFTDIARARSRMPDVVITQIPSLELSECVKNFCTQRNIPYIVDIRDLWPDNYKRILPKWAKFLYPYIFYLEELRCKNALNGAKGIVAISQTYLNWALSKVDEGISSKVVYIGYRYSDKKNFKPSEREDIKRSFGVPLNKILICFAGTFCSSYDLETVFKASVEMKARGIPAHIIVAGDGSGYLDLKRRFSESESITYIGWVESNKLANLLLISDLGLAPYSSEALMSLPNKLFEYLAYGLPILSSLKGELWDLIQEHGIGINYQSSDTHSLVNAVEEYSSNKDLLNEHRKNCLNIFNRKFNSDIVYSSLADFIEGVVEKDGRS